MTAVAPAMSAARTRHLASKIDNGNSRPRTNRLCAHRYEPPVDVAEANSALALHVYPPSVRLELQERKGSRLGVRTVVVKGHCSGEPEPVRALGAAQVFALKMVFTALDMVNPVVARVDLIDKNRAAAEVRREDEGARPRRLRYDARGTLRYPPGRKRPLVRAQGARGVKAYHVVGADEVMLQIQLHRTRRQRRHSRSSHQVLSNEPLRVGGKNPIPSF